MSSSGDIEEKKLGDVTPSPPLLREIGKNVAMRNDAVSLKLLNDVFKNIAHRPTF